MAENNETPENEEGAPKKEGFFKRLGKKFNDATYNIRMQSEFDTSHPKYVVYSGTKVLSVTPEIAVEEHLDEGYLLTLDDDVQIKEGNLIKTPSGDVLHIAAVEKSVLKVNFDGKENEVAATKVVLGKKATEVKVIKVEDKFYLA